MFKLEKKIETEQRFANLVYKDFQTKKFGLTPCCDADIDKIKWKKYLCDYQDQKNNDDKLEATEGLTITVLDCDNIPVAPTPAPPANTPVIPSNICQSLQFDGVNEDISYNTALTPSIYNFIDYNKTHTLSLWIQWTKDYSAVPPDVPQDTPIFTKYDYALGTGMILGILKSDAIFYQLSIGGQSIALMIYSPYTFITGSWYNITVTTDGLSTGNTKIYANGVLLTGVSYVNTLNASVQTVNSRYRVANIETAGAEQRDYFSKFVAHSLRGWSSILSASDVLTEFNNGVRLVNPVQSASLSLDLQMYNSVWNGSDFNVPESVQSVNFTSNTQMEQIDLLNICPQ
tara:strand:- start:49636 stop:50667 length:1032 start_codon:yes stop_codon:yes gene_type:complete